MVSNVYAPLSNVRLLFPEFPSAGIRLFTDLGIGFWLP